MVVEISMEVSGGEALRTALKRTAVRLDGTAERAVSEGMTILHRRMAETLTTSTHPIGTPTPSVPGEPPSLVTGNLRRSIDEYGPYYVGTHEVQGSVGPKAVYARIQELGGITGRNYATTLPARPYVRPTIELAGPEVQQRMADIFREAL